MAGGGDMMMILVVGAVALGGLFLINQSGGLGSILGGGAAPAPAPTEGEGEGEQPPEGGDQFGDEGPYERYSTESGPYGTTIRYETRIINGIPQRVPIGPGFGPGPPGPFPLPPPGPFGGPPRFPPGPGPRPGPGPSPCAKFCIPSSPMSNPIKCRQCKDAMGIKSSYARSYYGGRSCGCS